VLETLEWKRKAERVVLSLSSTPSSKPPTHSLCGHMSTCLFIHFGVLARCYQISARLFLSSVRRGVSRSSVLVETVCTPLDWPSSPNLKLLRSFRTGMQFINNTAEKHKGVGSVGRKKFTLRSTSSLDCFTDDKAALACFPPRTAAAGWAARDRCRPRQCTFKRPSPTTRRDASNE